MAIFVDENTKVVYQGLTGSQGRFYGLRNRDYGTQVVGRHEPEEGRHRRRRHPDLRDRWPTRPRRPAPPRPASSSRRRACKAAVLEAAEAGMELVVVHHRGRARAGRGVVLQPA